MEVFALNEMLVPNITWTPEETNSMSKLDTLNVYDALEKKFFQRIDIILKGDVKLFDPTQIAGPNGYYAQEMGKTMYELVDNKQQTIEKYTYQKISDKIKYYWKKFFNTLKFSDDLSYRYEAFKNDAKFIKHCKLNNKTPYEFIKFVYDSDKILEYPNANTKTKEYIKEGIFSPKNTNNSWVQKTNQLLNNSNSEIISSKYKDLMQKIESWKDDEKDQKWVNLKKDLEDEFIRLYRHFHMWVFANMIMSGGPIASSQSQSTSSSTSTKLKSSTSSVTTPTRERRIVDRAVIGQTISDL
jgi:hypothetical protein